MIDADSTKSVGKFNVGIASSLNLRLLDLYPKNTSKNKIYYIKVLFLEILPKSSAFKSRTNASTLK